MTTENATAPRPYDGTGSRSPQWWPSRYGPDDELGAGNELTPERTLAALQIPREGRTIELAQLLEAGVPVDPPRGWSQRILAHLSMESMPISPDGNQPTGFEEHVLAGYHIGCHVDALGHAGIAGRHYNGLHHRDFYSVTGLTRLGIEKARPWVARGVCLDIAGLEGVAMLDRGFVIEPRHLEAACSAQGVTIEAGNAVLLHTGWSANWMVDNPRYMSGEPGLGWDGAHWLSDLRVSLVGADNWALEVLPFEIDDRPYVVHQHLLAETGTYILENIKTHELVEGGHSEFLFILTPNKTKGSTGSMASPVAVV